MRKFHIGIAGAATAALLSVAAVHAQGGPPQIPGQLDPSRVEAGTYKTDKGHSLVGFRYRHFGFNDYFGIFGDVDATLTLDPKHLADAKVDATIPINPTVASDRFKADLLSEGHNGNKPAFFGPNPVPAHFVSTRVVPKGNNAQITGDLTLNGVTKPVTIDAEFTGAGISMMGQKKTVGFEGTATIKRSDFGLSTFVPMVADEVHLTISVAFEKQ